MKKPTERQIEKEIALLNEYRERVRPYTIFGDDNIEAITTQIRVLEDGLDDEDINNYYADERLVACAYDALQWRRGGAIEKPSDTWKPLLEK